MKHLFSQDGAGEKKEGAAPSSFGGYTARKEYEDGTSAGRAGKFALIALIAVLSVLSVFGVIGLARGDFFSKKQPEPASALKVPSVMEGNVAVQTPEEMIENVRESTVTLYLTLSDGSVLKRSCLVMTSDGVAVTDAQPFLTREVISLSAFAEPYGALPAFFTAADAATGIALIRLDASYEYTPPSFAAGASVRAGNEVFAVGDYVEASFYGCVLSGRVMTVIPKEDVYSGNPEERSFPLFYTDFTFNETCWGAPLVNPDGKVIGFCSSSPAPYRSGGTVIPVDTLLKMMNILSEMNS